MAWRCNRGFDGNGHGAPSRWQSPQALAPWSAPSSRSLHYRSRVRVTVSNGKIVKIEPVQLQNRDAKSQAISSYAAPALAQSVLAKQTAAVDTVSGATYTSLSYEASLQSALDKIAFKAPDGSTASTDVSQLQ